MYTFGCVATDDDIAKFETLEDNCVALSKLEKRDPCWILRSEGHFTFARVVKHDNDSLVVRVNSEGSTKSIPLKACTKYIRLVKGHSHVPPSRRRSSTTTTNPAGMERRDGGAQHSSGNPLQRASVVDQHHGLRGSLRGMGSAHQKRQPHPPDPPPCKKEVCGKVHSRSIRFGHQADGTCHQGSTSVSVKVKPQPPHRHRPNNLNRRASCTAVLEECQRQKPPEHREQLPQKQHRRRSDKPSSITASKRELRASLASSQTSNRELRSSRSSLASSLTSNEELRKSLASSSLTDEELQALLASLDKEPRDDSDTENIAVLASNERKHDHRDNKPQVHPDTTKPSLPSCRNPKKVKCNLTLEDQLQQFESVRSHGANSSALSLFETKSVAERLRVSPASAASDPKEERPEPVRLMTETPDTPQATTREDTGKTSPRSITRAFGRGERRNSRVPRPPDLPEHAVNGPRLAHGADQEMGKQACEERLVAAFHSIGV